MHKNILRQRMWHRVKYQVVTPTCESCTHSDKNQWDQDSNKGVCAQFPVIPFEIVREGVCKYHSSFNGANIVKG